jgi:hypothetical protein
MKSVPQILTAQSASTAKSRVANKIWARFADRHHLRAKGVGKSGKVGRVDK